MRSINDARYTMWATVVPRLETPNGGGIDNHSASDRGSYQIQSDPDSGQPVTVWVPEANPTVDTPTARYDIRCYARGYTNLGFRSSANRETFFHNEYDEIESVQFDYPRRVLLSHQSFVTNIRSTQVDDPASYIWTDAATGKAIVWEVQGTTPVTDPFGKPLRYTTVLRRAQIQ